MIPSRHVSSSEPSGRAGRAPRARPLVGAALAAAVVAAVLTGCGGDGDRACGPLRREPLDRRSVHVLPGAEEPQYRTDPPTSGPHLASPDGDPVRDEPIPPVVQVGVLEEGGVLLQHHGLTDEERSRLEALAGGDVVVAPAEGLPEGAAVIATAWVTKMVCAELDTEALRRFAADEAGAGPGGHA